jgi:aminopeptidase
VHHKKDLILGVQEKGVTVQKPNDVLFNHLNQTDLVKNAKWELGKVRLSYTSEEKYNRVAFLGVGKPKEEKEKTIEEKHKPLAEKKYKQNNKVPLTQQFKTQRGDWSMEQAEKVREAVKNAVAALKSDDRKNTSKIVLDTTLAGEAYEQQAVEGAILGSYEFKLADNHLYETGEEKPITIEPLRDSKAFKKGKIYANAQILAATLAETPANWMTPTIFANVMRQKFNSLDNEKVTVEIHDADWALQKEMNSFLAVAQGSDQEPRVLEVTYRGNPNDHETVELVLVGKGITFDSGGISLKPGAGMKDMKGDMGGAAATMAALHAIAQLGLPINVKGLAFLCENMPSGRAVKPGDVVRAMNKKSIEIDNTDAEGRLILADALCYASEMKPKVVIDCATLTGAIVIALGDQMSGVFSSSNDLWAEIDEAGQVTNDYMWRMPLFQEAHLKQLKTDVAKLVNVGGREAGSCTAASFLSQFVDFDKVDHWAHIDIAGSSMTKKGMTGRPTRALIEIATNLCNNNIVK